jgi:hypothetical protein
MSIYYLQKYHKSNIVEDGTGILELIREPTLLKIRVLPGFFTNTYNKPYPLGFFTL